MDVTNSAPGPDTAPMEVVDNPVEMADKSEVISATRDEPAPEGH
jgi:hypothetical protein